MNAHAPFYFTFIGRGIAYLLLGSVLLVFGHDYSIATGAITIIVAFVYFAFSGYTKWCISDSQHLSLPPPLVQFNDVEFDDKHDSIKDANERQETPDASTTDEFRNKEFKERQFKANQDINKALEIHMDGSTTDGHGAQQEKEEDLHHL
eukprot:CAMPEP_0201574508 /NCGR_PEP_ID=MMETSP0190_2-20130828/19036_1 /ASSEMBLY_ACC=CAM_ASM_000263 /TAXON_ID=37353 /ORGANISM="Rosalina sp." /LENGTH=148 /DNA_ID=CAMNT_0048002829 /DNA_START=341 /DNA_END=787 /DNA_ORIENTATION=+